MSKRTLFIIIGLLIFLDLASFLIYFVSNSNRDGKSPLEFSFGDTVASKMADTIPDVLIEDKFDTISHSVTYASQDLIDDGGVKKHMISTINLKFVWPVSINGRKHFHELEQALMHKISSRDFITLQECIDTLLLHPRFAKPTKRFTRIDHAEQLANPLQSTHSYRVFPYFRTTYLLEMVVLVEHSLDLNIKREMKIVHYDRMHDKVILIDEIFDMSQSKDILALVNQGIENLKTKKKNKTIHEISVLPHEFLLGSKSVIFYLPDGLIADPGSGSYEVYVSNDELKPYFTEFYNELLNNDDNFQSYGYLTF